MGMFTAKLKIWNPAHPERFEEFEPWVDTGAAYSWFSRERLQRLGIRASDRRQFRTVEGGLIERDMASLFMSADGRTGGDTVVMAEAADMDLLGAHSLEALGLATDVVQGRLIRIEVGLALTAHLAG